MPVVYIDESGFSHDMPRTHGYAKIGERCFGTHDWGAKGRTNVIGALIGQRLLTLALFDCTINTDAFTAWTEQDLLPKLSTERALLNKWKRSLLACKMDTRNIIGKIHNDKQNHKSPYQKLAEI